MPPSRKMFLIRDVQSGKMFTVVSTSARTALADFVAKRTPPKGSEFEVKERGSPEDWVVYGVGGR